MGSTQHASKDLPTFDLEMTMRDRHGGPVAGIDEAGRGPWAGPVVAAAVILDPDRIPLGLNDSKKLTDKMREDRFEAIMATARVAVAIGEVERIDRDNILQATFWCMISAFEGLGTADASALIDGNKAPGGFPASAQPVVKGDARSVSIAAASIIAKVTRDRLMRDLAEQFPFYGWESNKGYGTAQHIAGIEQHGICAQHRRSFAPVRRFLAAQSAT